jgi:cobalamin biosynthesis protein CobT
LRYLAGNARLEFAKASQLPAVIAAEQHQLADEKQLLKRDTAERRKLTAQYRLVILISIYNNFLHKLCEILEKT